jgi:phosphoglycolate phosphatase
MRGTAALNSQPLLSCKCLETAASSQHLTVFCDFDGPLVDVSNRYYSTYQQALAYTQAYYQAEGITLPIQLLSKEQFWQMKQERAADAEIAMRSGLQEKQIGVFIEHVVQIVNNPALLQKDKMQPGVNWALALLHSHRVRLVLVTLRCQAQTMQILQNYGLARLFSGVYGTHDSHAAYQNYADVKTQLLAKAIAEQLPDSGVKIADYCWMVGDTEADILAGQALSISTIALTCGIRSRLYLRQFQPTRIHNDLLSVAHYLLKELQVFS